jgi:hypothetical protein
MWCVGVGREKLGKGRGRGKEDFGVYFYEVNLPSEWKGDFTTRQDSNKKERFRSSIRRSKIDNKPDNHAINERLLA